ncbi:MAG: PD40 domain-containing protein [Chloroflexi bacterium]|nr:PD40 domain-containing protein [Chloroflexota bacterium]
MKPIYFLFACAVAVALTSACQSAPAPTAVSAQPAQNATQVPPAAPTNTTAPVATKTNKVVYSQCDGKCDQPEKAHIWTSTADGGGAKKLIDRGLSPSFAPDGTQFVYENAQDGIYIASVDGAVNKKLVSGTGASVPEWSHDGKTIAFVERTTPGGAAAPKRFFFFPLFPGATPVPPPGVPKLLRPLPQIGNSFVKTILPDGTNLKTLTIGDHPTWSADDTEIAYDTCQGSTCGIFRIKATGGDPVRVTDDVGAVPSWSRDGKKILYQRDVDGIKHLFVVNVDGSGKTQLTKGPVLHVDGVWSLEGNTIFLRSPVLGSWDLLVLNADGTGLRKILGDVSPVAWEDEKLSLSK